MCLHVPEKSRAQRCEDGDAQMGDGLGWFIFFWFIYLFFFFCRGGGAYLEIESSEVPIPTRN